MSSIIGETKFGLLNGDFSKGIPDGWENVGIYHPEGPPGRRPGSVLCSGSSTTVISKKKVYVDVNKTYQYSLWKKAYSLSVNGNPPDGHLGFACFDKYDGRIDLRQNGKGGASGYDTYLSRDLNPGDSYMYVQDASNWSNSIYSYARTFILFPPTHPEYHRPHEWSRIGYGEYNLNYPKDGIVDLGGEYRVQLVDYATQTPTTFPDIGYPTPAGTPVSWSSAGSSFNYVFGADDIPFSWTYNSTIISGQGTWPYSKMRYGTVYIKFLWLRNYYTREGPPYASALFSNIMFRELINGKEYQL